MGLRVRIRVKGEGAAEVLGVVGVVPAVGEGRQRREAVVVGEGRQRRVDLG